MVYLKMYSVCFTLRSFHPRLYTTLFIPAPAIFHVHLRQGAFSELVPHILSRFRIRQPPNPPIPATHAFLSPTLRKVSPNHGPISGGEDIPLMGFGFRTRLFDLAQSPASRGGLFGHNNHFIPLAAHPLYPSFLLYTGVRRNRAPAKDNSRTNEKDNLTSLSRSIGKIYLRYKTRTTSNI